MFKVFKNQKGTVVLMLTVLILTSTLMVTLTIAEMVRSGLLMGITQFHSTQAYFAAEAGGERILWEIFDNQNDYNTVLGCNDEDCIRFRTTGVLQCFGNCTHATVLIEQSNNTKFRVYKKSAPGSMTLESEGYYGDMAEKRVIKITL